MVRGRRLALFVVAALLTACSGDDATGDSTPTTGSATPTTGATPAESPPGTSATAATGAADETDETMAGTSASETVDSADVTSSSPSSAPESRYSATIRRDGAGVPHIEAEDWGSLGFGQGWALAEDRACTLIDQVIKVRGERARWFGAGEDDEHVESDLAYRHLGLHAEVPTRWADQPEQVVDVIEGYVAGFNAQLDDVGPDGVNGWCAGEPWVQPITTDDLYAVVGDILLLASGNNFISAIATAQPPGAATAPTEPPGTAADPAATSVPVTTGASNGWAFGADRSATGGGLLLANPHYPWEGELRFWEAHLTIPGELDAYGVALSGLPGLQIAFNEEIAWTHTVSAGHRFTLYRYDLVPGDPTSYLVDGAAQPMTPTEISVEVAGVDGAAPSQVTRTLWSTHHGPVINLGPLGWSAEQAVAIRDANAEITSVLAQYLAMDTATSMDELQAAHEEHQGVPWVNTIATSADGRAWYADTSATPNLSAEALAAWAAEREAGGLLALAYDEFGVVLLDGSNSVYEWVDDPAAPAPGLVPYADLPQLERTDYVFNANDSYWLAHPDELLTGYSPMHGEEGIAQSPRTRMNAVLVGESTEPWSIEDMQTAIFSNRSVLAELLRPAVVEACTATPTVDVDGQPVDLTAACAALAGWDGTYELDARGAALWREFVARFEFDERTAAGRLFADTFDPADPVGTPVQPAADRAPWLVELGRAVQFMTSLGVPVDAPLGDWQWEVRTGDRIPMHGGDGVEGVANVVSCCADPSSRQPIADDGEYPDDLGYLTDLPGYPISTGASFVMALEYGPDGPVAEGFLTYGNPDDPADPAYRAGLEAFSAKEWRTFNFTDEAISADPDLEEITVTGG